MLFIVLFTDNPDARPDLRKQHMPDHLRFLQENADAISAAGPLFEAEGGQAAGGIWLVKAPRPEDVDKLIKSDPFWVTGLRHNHRILEWRQVFADRTPLV